MIVLASIVYRLFSLLLGLHETPGLKVTGLRPPLGFACENVAALLREHARSWGVSRRELRNVIVMAHPESWVAPLE